MKRLCCFLFLPMCACGLRAGEDPAAPAAYVDEAPLPKEWPRPGPYGKVVEKSYPQSRAAFTTGKGTGIAFWTLFSHIKRHGIPMTAPVEMGLAEEQGGGVRRETMAFLYQDTAVGTAGMDGKSVEVRDVAPMRVLSYAWQGGDTPENVAAAKSALEGELRKRGSESKGYRLLGYNGPSTPREKATWELQATL